MLNPINNADCRNVLANLEDESVNGVFTDPPFNINLCPQRKTHGGIINDAMPPDEFAELIKVVFQQIYRVLKSNTATWVCCNWQSFNKFYDIVEHCGFNVVNTIVWVKNVFGLGWHFRPQHEFIIAAFKGNPPVPEVAISNVWCVSRLTKTIHPTEKPLELIQKALLQYNKEGDVILDPFAGSFSTCLAAKQLGMKYIGIEQDPTYYEIGKERLAHDSITLYNKKGFKIKRYEAKSLLEP